MLTYWETLTAIQSNVLVKNSYAELWGKKSQGGYTVGTYTGTLPAALTGTTAGYLHRYKIYGNTEQAGTPTPETPIVPSECGEKTAQLWNEEYLNGYYTSSNVYLSADNQICSKSKIAVKPNTTYWFGVTSRLGTAFLGVLKYNENAEFIERENTASYKGNGVVFTTDASTYYINVNFGAYYGSVYKGDIIIAESSTPLPYIPYGYKLPLTSAGQNVDIYLGESQTTRRIKKLVLTGEETFALLEEGLYRVTVNGYLRELGLQIGICSHFGGGMTVNAAPRSKLNAVSFLVSSNGNNYVYFSPSQYLTVNDYKTYLAQQYANGTPVTVWYVLAEPETGIVNEPLMKIGDYADTIDSTQTTAQIPTSANSTTISWAGEGLAPSEVELKYEKWR